MWLEREVNILSKWSDLYKSIEVNVYIKVNCGVSKKLLWYDIGKFVVIVRLF